MPMVMYFPVALQCDSCDAVEELSWGFDPAAQRNLDKRWFHDVDAGLREEAASLGWQMGARSCYCPECVSKAREDGKLLSSGGTDAKAVLGDLASIVREARKGKSGSKE